MSGVRPSPGMAPFSGKGPSSASFLPKYLPATNRYNPVDREMCREYIAHTSKLLCLYVPWRGVMKDGARLIGDFNTDTSGGAMYSRLLGCLVDLAWVRGSGTQTIDNNSGTTIPSVTVFAEVVYDRLDEVVGVIYYFYHATPVMQSEADSSRMLPSQWLKRAAQNPRVPKEALTELSYNQQFRYTEADAINGNGPVGGGNNKMGKFVRLTQSEINQHPVIRDWHSYDQYVQDCVDYQRMSERVTNRQTRNPEASGSSFNIYKVFSARNAYRRLAFDLDPKPENYRAVVARLDAEGHWTCSPRANEEGVVIDQGFSIYVPAVPSNSYRIPHRYCFWPCFQKCGIPGQLPLIDVSTRFAEISIRDLMSKSRHMTYAQAEEQFRRAQTQDTPWKETDFFEVCELIATRMKKINTEEPFFGPLHTEALGKVYTELRSTIMSRSYKNNGRSYTSVIDYLLEMCDGRRPMNCAYMGLKGKNRHGSKHYHSVCRRSRERVESGSDAGRDGEEGPPTTRQSVEDSWDGPGSVYRVLNESFFVNRVLGNVQNSEIWVLMNLLMMVSQIHDLGYLNCLWVMGAPGTSKTYTSKLVTSTTIPGLASKIYYASKKADTGTETNQIGRVLIHDEASGTLFGLEGEFKDMYTIVQSVRSTGGSISNEEFERWKAAVTEIQRTVSVLDPQRDPTTGKTRRVNMETVTYHTGVNIYMGNQPPPPDRAAHDRMIQVSAAAEDQFVIIESLLNTFYRNRRIEGEGESVREASMRLFSNRTSRDTAFMSVMSILDMCDAIPSVDQENAALFLLSTLRSHPKLHSVSRTRRLNYALSMARTIQFQACNHLANLLMDPSHPNRVVSIMQAVSYGYVTSYESIVFASVITGLFREKAHAVVLSEIAELFFETFVSMQDEEALVDSKGFLVEDDYLYTPRGSFMNVTRQSKPHIFTPNGALVELATRVCQTNKGNQYGHQMVCTIVAMMSKDELERIDNRGRRVRCSDLALDKLNSGRIGIYLGSLAQRNCNTFLDMALACVPRDEIPRYIYTGVFENQKFQTATIPVQPLPKQELRKQMELLEAYRDDYRESIGETERALNELREEELRQNRRGTDGNIASYAAGGAGGREDLSAMHYGAGQGPRCVNLPFVPESEELAGALERYEQAMTRQSYLSFLIDEVEQSPRLRDVLSEEIDRVRGKNRHLVERDACSGPGLVVGNISAKDMLSMGINPEKSPDAKSVSSRCLRTYSQCILDRLVQVFRMTEEQARRHPVYPPNERRLYALWDPVTISMTGLRLRFASLDRTEMIEAAVKELLLMAKKFADWNEFRESLYLPEVYGQKMRESWVEALLEQRGIHKPAVAKFVYMYGVASGTPSVALNRLLVRSGDEVCPHGTRTRDEDGEQKIRECYRDDPRDVMANERVGTTQRGRHAPMSQKDDEDPDAMFQMLEEDYSQSRYASSQRSVDSASVPMAPTEGIDIRTRHTHPAVYAGNEHARPSRPSRSSRRDSRDDARTTAALRRQWLDEWTRMVDKHFSVGGGSPGPSASTKRSMPHSQRHGPRKRACLARPSILSTQVNDGI